MRKIKKTLTFDQEEFEKFQERVEKQGASVSTRLREFIYRDNLHADLEQEIPTEYNLSNLDEKRPKTAKND